LQRALVGGDINKLNDKTSDHKLFNNRTKLQFKKTFRYFLISRIVKIDKSITESNIKYKLTKKIVATSSKLVATTKLNPTMLKTK